MRAQLVKRWIWRGAIVLALVFAVMQIVPYGREHSSPPPVREPAWDSPDTRALAARACFDCHSNQTRWPAYASVAPASWMIQRHVTEGREVMNFSEWQRQYEEAHEAAEVLLEHEMPPLSYRILHPEARLTSAERDRLASGLARTVGTENEEHEEVEQR